MNLRAIHLVFITCATLLAFVVGGWSFAQGARAGASYTVMGALSVAVGIALVVYGAWFWRKIQHPEVERRRRRKLFHTVSVLALAVLAAPPAPVLACSTCYGAASGPMVDAARLGVFVLLGIVLAVQFGLLLFFLYLRRRAKLYGPRVAPWWSTIEEPVKR